MAVALTSNLDLDGAATAPLDPPEAEPGWRLPPEAHLAMPIQDLWRRPAAARRAPMGEADVWQIGVFLLAGALAVFGGVAAYNTLQVGGVSPLEFLNLVLFQVLFAWIAYALACALIGFGVSLGGGSQTVNLVSEGPIQTPVGLTAILMPVHNEEPHGVVARLCNVDASLRALGVADRFHLFLLSDTRDAQIREAEIAAFDRLRRATGQAARLFYRLRADNQGRKAGNVAEWVRRFGGAYDYMVVLDADSVMDGDTLARLADAMDQQPRTGLIQTVPRLVNRKSVFGRVQQFASRLYGPMLSDGLAHTSGTAGNYWGHNAIIRVAAFAGHAGLPRLRGPRPLGGEILSHDFVEAALLRRAGWDIRLAPQLEGSFEECPPSLPDMMVRERRWCQGNLQHLPLIAARGLHWMSRVHLAQGVLTYLMPPLWLLFLLVGAALSATTTHMGRAGWDDESLDMLKWLLAISLLSLFIPRVLALFRALARPEERAAWGDSRKLVVGVLCETALSALMAPIMMTAQTKAIFDIVLGRDSGWAAQRRSDGSLSWDEAKRTHWPQTAFGIAFGLIAFVAAPSAAVWMLPVILGLVLAIPISVFTADPALGMRLERAGVFVTPEERTPSPVLAGLTKGEPRPQTPALDWRLSLDRLFRDPVMVEADA
jgi:membrane glycosyltransferase